MRRVPILLVLILGAAVMLRAQGAWNAPIGRDFPLAGGDVGNQRHSSLTRITPANISRLGAAWMIHVGEPVQGPASQDLCLPCGRSESVLHRHGIGHAECLGQGDLQSDHTDLGRSGRGPAVSLCHGDGEGCGRQHVEIQPIAAP